jgi:hypothetical protein
LYSTLYTTTHESYGTGAGKGAGTTAGEVEVGYVAEAEETTEAVAVTDGTVGTTTEDAPGATTEEVGAVADDAGADEELGAAHRGAAAATFPTAQVEASSV